MGRNLQGQIHVDALAQAVEPDRIERAKRELADLLDMLEGDRLGLVAFAGTAFVQCPLTVDYRAYRLHEGKLKGPDCPECRWFPVCEGPWREYPERYGFDEFRPVPGGGGEGG